MDDPSYVALVDAHAKSDGGTDHKKVILFESLLCLVAVMG